MPSFEITELGHRLGRERFDSISLSGSAGSEDSQTDALKLGFASGLTSPYQRWPALGHSMVLSTFSLVKWGVSCLINWFFRASPFPVLGDYDTSRSITFAWLTVVFCPLQASHDHMFHSTIFQTKVFQGFPLRGFCNTGLPPLSKPPYFPFQSPTHIPWHPFPQRHRRWWAFASLSF